MATSNPPPNHNPNPSSHDYTAAAASSSSSSFPLLESSFTHNTTFVQADPSSFRAVVQKLTGNTNITTPTTEYHHKLLPASRQAPVKPITNSGDKGPRRPAFKLHERRETARKLEIKLGNDGRAFTTRQRSLLGFGGGGSGEMVVVSPVSPLEILAAARGSPRTPRSPAEEEEKAIAEKGFYLHPSPLSTPRGSQPPELLPLFPLQSPREDVSSSCS